MNPNPAVPADVPYCGPSLSPYGKDRDKRITVGNFQTVGRGPIRFENMVASDPAPVYNEQWSSESELAMLKAATEFVKPLSGAIIEIGCWEGPRAVVIAIACY